MLLASLLLMIGGSVALGFAVGRLITERRAKRQAELERAWEFIVAANRVDPLMQQVRYPPAHKRLIN